MYTGASALYKGEVCHSYGAGLLERKKLSHSDFASWDPGKRSLPLADEVKIAGQVLRSLVLHEQVPYDHSGEV